MISLNEWVNPKTKRAVPLCGNVVPRSEFQLPREPMNVGVEHELLVRDGDMNPAGMAVQEVFKPGKVPLDGRISVEAMADIVEAKTAPHRKIADLVADLRGTILELHRYFAREGRVLLPLSLGPTEVFGAQSFNYDFIREIALNKHGIGPSRLNGICSTQFNIEVGEGNALLFVHKVFRRLIPLLVALTANSPFHGGFYTHMLAMRANMRGLILDAGGWMAEYIHETDWGEYLARRARMCEIGVVMSAPWAHNGPLRLRPDRQFCLEIAPCEVIPDLRVLGAMADFLRRIVARLLQCYIDCGPVPEFFGASDDFVVQKNMQEAVIRGRKGSFLTGDLKVISVGDALRQLVTWASEAEGDPSWGWEETVPLREIIDHGTPAERMVEEFQTAHDCPNGIEGCPSCVNAIRDVCRAAAEKFAKQLTA